MSQKYARFGLWHIDDTHPEGGAWTGYQGRTLVGSRDEIGRFVDYVRLEAHPLPDEITDTITVDEYRARAADGSS